MVILYNRVCACTHKCALLLHLTVMFPFLTRKEKNLKDAAFISFLKQVATFIITSLYSTFDLKLQEFKDSCTITMGQEHKIEKVMVT